MDRIRKFIRHAAIGSLAAISLSSYSLSAVATERWHASTLRAVYIVGDDVLLAFNADAQYCTAPAGPKYHYMSVGQNGVTQEGFKRMYAAALMAFSTGAPVQMEYDDATTNCFVNRIYVGT